MARGWFGDSEAHKEAGRKGGLKNKRPKGFAVMTKEEVQQIRRSSRKRSIDK